MEFHFTNISDEEFCDDSEQIRSIAKKSWLSTASTSLAQLEKVQTNIYNVGLTDPKDLKATNIRARRPGNNRVLVGDADSGTDKGSVKSATLKAWGSNSSIPDSVRHQNGHILPKPTRPASAKNSTTLTRPPSGRKPRPQSAKEPLPSGTVSEQVLGVKGAKYDPSGRPPKGVPNTNSMGWVGPPAGLKYPDRPPDGVPWHMDFLVNGEEHDFDVGVAISSSVSHEAPPPVPVSTPEPEEKTKRVFELFIGDPYTAYEDIEDEDVLESSEDEDLLAPPSPKEYHHPPVNHTKNFTHFDVTEDVNHTPNVTEDVSHSPEESLKLCLPIADDDFDEADEMDTERLLAEAESVYKEFNLKNIISANKNIPITTEQVSSASDVQETIKKAEFQSHDLDQANEKPEIKNESSNNNNKDTSPNKTKAEELVSKIIDENGLVFKKNRHQSNESKIERDKSGVKFNENVTTVNITPRNVGRKVEELHQKKKHAHHKTDSFVDLIEIRNRIEPVLSTGKADLTEREIKSSPRVSSKPPVGKSMATERSRPMGHPVQSSTKKSVTPNASTAVRNDTVASSCSKPHTSQQRQRPSSAPLNRLPRPVTTVTVDYGEEEPPKEEKKKKSNRKHKDDVVTMMQQINLSDHEEEILAGHKGHECRGQGHHVNGEKIVYDENEPVKDLISAPTVYKSEHEKNYYEISRYSSMSSIESKDNNENKVLKECTLREITVYKTTKTLEFDETEPKEVTVRNVIDPLAIAVKEKERFLATSPELKHRKPPSRPSSAKPSVSKKSTTADDLERPGSRLGFVAMAPDSSEGQGHKPKVTRPSSAPTYRRSKVGVKDKENKAKDEKEKTRNEKKELTEKEKQEREKLIDNLLERTKTLLDDKQEPAEETASETPATEKKKSRRPYSAHNGTLARITDDSKKETLKRPTSEMSTHKHYASYSRGSSSGHSKRKKTPRKPRVIYTEPCIINTNTSYFEEETEEDVACLEMEKELAKKGVTISAATLQRALYPPSGKSRYYQITADLPKQSSLSLLSHPKVWLPEEYKRLQKAERSLARANEIMFLQEKAAKRKAYLESLTPEQRQKLKQKAKKGKKGKKGGSKLRRSKSAL